VKFDTSSFKGLSFGAVSGAITTLGMMVGLDAGTNSRVTVMLGVLTISIADALSDALGVHVSEESEKKNDSKIWKSTLSTFVSKLFFALSFLVPLFFFELNIAIIISVSYGFALIGVVSYLIAKKQGENSNHIIIEHLFIAVIVVIITYFVGKYFALLNIT